MMLLDFQQTYAHVTFGLSIFSNSLLLSLLIFRRDKNLGSYKYLMFAFSFLGLFFSIVDFSNKPMVHIYGGAYLVFSLNSFGLPHFLANWFNALNCSCYGMTISLLAVHFIYRYLAVCRPNQMNWFMWPHTIVWFIFCSEISFEWWITAVLYAGETRVIDELVKDSMKTNYNLTKGEFIYAASLYYVSGFLELCIEYCVGFQRTNEKGEKTISWPDVLFAVNIVKLITICMTIVLFCGIATFRKLRTLRHTSKRTTTLQQQLFKALVTQTVIPVLTMFLPAAVMMISPLFEVTLGSYEGLIMTVITTYPCVDPMVVIFFVRDFRHAIWQTIRCKRCLYSRETYSLRGTAVSFITEPN
ncbi:hypothetical protein B9Z55_016522 [Caenorhabditis nigoni]|uniref:Serpentine receptor class r-10 n=1 Tax=Caenorhabditis nigoni TaxID=1611254 RepID=A0A2G5T5V0_9PELO|nr:hypothetical protein B9Z55_016522 [Caenorhabditis nigoni]